MNRAATALLAATAFAGIASQAQAQDSYVLPPPPPPGMGYQQPGYMPAPQMPAPVYQAQAYAEPGYPAQSYPAQAYQTQPYQGQAYPDPAYAPPSAYAPGPGYGSYGAGLPPVASVGYTRDERDQWLKDCRLAYEGKIKRDSSLFGLLAGAATGGFIGAHERKGQSDRRRLGGTLIGAGVGGLVGLALGAIVGGAFEKKKKDQCEDYLERYQGGGYLPGPEAGFGQGWQRNIDWGQYGYGNYGYGYGGYTTVMVPVQVGAGYTYGAPIRTENRYVVEDVIEEVVTVPRTKYVKRAPVTKYVPTKYVKDKRVRYSK